VRYGRPALTYCLKLTQTSYLIIIEYIIVFLLTNIAIAYVLTTIKGHCFLEWLVISSNICINLFNNNDYYIAN